MTHSLKTQTLTRIVGPGVITGFFILASCASNECLENKNSLPLAGFYNSDTVPKQISLDSVSIFGIKAPGDSMIQDNARSISQTYLPFRIDQGETQYVIQYNAGLLGKHHIADTITFSYDIVPWFVSSACGAVYDYKITSIESTHNIIDSVTCPEGVIDNKDTENIKIYFRVAISEEGENL